MFRNGLESVAGGLVSLLGTAAILIFFFVSWGLCVVSVAGMLVGLAVCGYGFADGDSARAMTGLSMLGGSFLLFALLIWLTGDRN